MKPNSSRVRKWHGWLDRIVKEVVFLKSFIEMRRHFFLILDQSPVKNVKDAFWAYLSCALLDELVIRAVRICDRQSNNKKRQVVSLRAALEEFAKYSDYFTRRRFVGRIHPPPDNPTSDFQGGPQPISPIEEYHSRNFAFDLFVGRGASRLSKQEIEGDIEKLDDAISKLRIFRHKFIAHNDLRKKSRKPPQYEEIPTAVMILSELTHKYNMLLTRNDNTMELDRHTDLIRLFGAAWIQTEEARQDLKRQFRRGQDV